MLMSSSEKEVKKWVKDKRWKDEEENFAQEISINDSQYSHELWRCNSIALLEKSLWMIVYILMNFEDATESCLKNLYQ